MSAIRPTAPTYSDAPAATVDLSTLTDSRFILPGRRLPFRDASGRVNLHLVNASLAQYDPFAHGVQAGAKLLQWQRHARRALEARPADERLTLDDLCAPPPNPQTPAAADKAVSSPPRAVRRGAAPCAPAREAPKTVAMQRRLFRPPREDDEPTIDRSWLVRIAAQRGAKRRQKASTPKSDEETSAAEEEEEDEVADHREESGAQDADDAAARSRSDAEVEAEEEDDDEASSAGASSSSSSGASSSSRAGHSSSAEHGESDVYEVEEVLDEDELGRKGFLIRWAGYGPEHDSWEPEENVAPQLVEDFRNARRLVRNHQGCDYMDGRTRMLWCTPCCKHLPADSFSANMRRCDAAGRQCLNHHYARTGPTPARAHQLRKRTRDDARDDARGDGPSTPHAPLKAARPIARALSHRQAALQVERTRLFGF